MMAIYHFSMKPISRGAGRSVTAAAAYRSASRIHDERTNRVHDYSAKRGVISDIILAPSRAPDWAQDPQQLWNRVEHNEKRKDARLARENIVALPHELDVEANKKWLHQFVNDNYVKRGMVAQVSIHAPDHEGDKRNIHAHILLTDRQVTRNGFKDKKVRSWNDKATLLAWREAFADHMNQALEAHGHQSRVDHRSYKAQGIDREPTQHMGPAANQIEREDKTSDIGQKNRLTKVFNRNLETMKRDKQRIEKLIQIEEARIAKKDRALKSEINDRYLLIRKENELIEAQHKAKQADGIIGKVTGQKARADQRVDDLQEHLNKLQDHTVGWQPNIPHEQANECEMNADKAKDVKAIEQNPPLRAIKPQQTSSSPVSPLPGVRREGDESPKVSGPESKKASHDHSLDHSTDAHRQKSDQKSQTSLSSEALSETASERDKLRTKFKERMQEARKKKSQDRGRSL